MAKLIAGKYEIIGKVGQGGMGSVYKARHTALDTIVALKQLPADLAQDPDLVARFMREAQIMARLRHENIVKVSDILQEGKLYYLVEDFVDGQDLRQYLQSRGTLPPAEALEIACQVARALAYAHGRGVIHRDIKPNNVLLEHTVPVHALLADFGIAKVEDSGDSTVTGTYLGSPKYSAPEQIGYGRKKGQRPQIDGRTDVFSLGLVIYEMCEGRQFFADLEPYEIIGRVVYDAEPLTPHFTRPVPARLTAILTRAIAREPTQRYQGMAEFLGELEGCGRELFDEDGATVAVRQPTAAVQPPTADDSVSDRELEEQIRALERERQRRLALSAQTAARAARENAATTGADELAVELFRQALTREQEGSAALRDSAYLRARDLLEQAEGAFKEAASAAAAARAAREAEAARVAVSEARTLAEREEAQEHAATLYRRAQSLEEEANQARERQALAEARQRYTDAQALYQEARESAVLVRQRGAAERALAAVATVRAAADEAGAAEWAGGLWQEARSQEDRAASLLAGGQFTDAQDLFRAAAATFERAGQQAVQERETARERERGRAEAARAQAAETARAAEGEAGTAPGAAEAVREARAAFEAGDRCLQGGDYGEALRAFEQSGLVFAEIVASARQEADRAAAEAAERERRRREAEDAQQRAEQAAGDVGQRNLVTRFAPTLAAQARAALEKGERLLQTADYADAGREFEQARALFVDAASVASQARQRELDGAVEAKQAAAEAEREAQRLVGDRSPSAALEDARQRAAAAEIALEHEEFAAARQGFLESATRFREGAAEAVRMQDEATVIHTERVRPQDVPTRFPIGEKPADLEDAAVVTARRHLDDGTFVPQQEPGGPEAAVTSTRGGEAVAAGDGTAVTRAKGVWPAPSFEEGEAEAEAEAKKEAEEVKSETVVVVEHPPRKRRVAPLGIGAGLAVAALVGVIAYVNWPFTETPDLPPEKAVTEPKPTPDVPRPADVPPQVLAWGTTLPAESEVEVAEGEQLAFAVEVANPAAFPEVQYTWHLDGVEQSQGAHWDFAPGFDVAGPSAEPARKEIRVVASAGGQTSQKAWVVGVTDTNRPPAIESASPPEELIKLTAGEGREFSVAAVDPDTAHGDALTITWERNGQVVGQGPSWVLQEARTDDKEIRAVVTDIARAETLPRVWSLKVSPPANRPPRIVKRTPKARKVSVKEGETVRLSVQAKDPDAGDRLGYRWSFDGRPVEGTEAARRFTVPAEPGEYRAQVEVADRENAKVKASWNLVVARAEPPPPSPAPPDLPPPRPPEVRELEISEAEVRAWLKSYERAYDTKDAYALLRIGALRDKQQADRMKKVFDGYDGIDAKLESTVIKISEDHAHADVTFVTVITDLGTGKRQPPPPPVTYRLRKTKGVVIGRR